MLKLNQISSLYIGKIMYALFLMSILETLTSFLILSPVMRMVQNEMSMAVIKGTTFALAFLAITVWLTFQFGFAVMLLQMTRRKNTNLGYIFIGFKCFKPAGKIISALALFISLLALFARFIAKFIFQKIDPNFSMEAPDLSALQENTQEAAELLSSQALDTLLFIGVFLAILFILALVILVRFIFVFQLHFDNPKMPLFSLFRKSSQMMNKNVFRLILFALRAGGKQLVIAIFLAILVNFIPEEKNSSLSILVFLLDMVYFINFYTAMVKIYLTVPVMYEEILNPTLEIENKDKQEEISPLKDE